jgi:hypothetical protein
MTSTELAANVLFPSMLISLDHIRYSCDLNLNGGFFTMFGSLLLQLVGISYIMDKFIGDFPNLKNIIFFNKTSQGVEIT